MKLFSFFRLLIIVNFTILMISCGGSSSTGGSGTSTVYATAQLGNLAGSYVKIYQVNDNGSLILKWEETTTDGDTLDKIGKFDTHASELKSDEFYLFSVTGGKDWDVDDDGIKDTNPTLNNGSIRALAKGNNIQGVGGRFKVTVASELLYQKVEKEFKYDFNKTTFGNLLNQKSALIIEDLDTNGVIDINDLLSFDPVNHKNRLSELYKTNLDQIIGDIHQGGFLLPQLNSIVGSIDINGSSTSIVLSNDNSKAFITSNIRKNLQDYTRLEVIDIGDLSSMSIIGSIEIQGKAKKITLSHDNTKVFIISEVTVSSADNFMIVDINNLSNLSLIGGMHLQGHPTDVVVSSDDTKAYITGSDFDIVNISNPNNLSIIGSFDTNNSQGVVISSDETKAYIVNKIIGLIGTAGSSLNIIDISNKANPSLISNINISTTSFFAPYSYQVTLSHDNKKAFITHDIGLSIVDISDINNPFVINNQFSLNSLKEITISQDDSRVYVTTAGGNFQVIDISTPTDIKIINNIDTSGNIKSIVLSSDGTKVFVANDSKGLQILDINNLESSIIGGVDTSGFAKDVVLSSDGTKAYIADNSSGLQIVDITNSLNPTIVGSIDTPNYACSVVLSSDGTTAYVADGNSGLLIINITNPSNPTLLANIPTINARGVTLSSDGTKAYIADGSSGLQIVDISNY